MGKKRCSRCKKVRPVDVVVKDLEGKIKEHLCHACSHKNNIKATRQFDRRFKENTDITAWDMAAQNNRNHGIERVCPVCFKFFIANNANHKYCNLNCQHTAKRSKIKYERKIKKYILKT